ncbi:MAG: twin-arginine translocation signal domain-containing protein [Marivivens sp.]|jgi:hypothetical protein|nr:twin-arginine translocation signal domain-containing protein [Marivivens sp.]
MTKPVEKADKSRRNFLKAASVAPVAAAAAAAGTQAAAVEAEHTDTTRIQDTAHIRAFYETARF